MFLLLPPLLRCGWDSNLLPPGFSWLCLTRLRYWRGTRLEEEGQDVSPVCLCQNRCVTTNGFLIPAPSFFRHCQHLHKATCALTKKNQPPDFKAHPYVLSSLLRGLFNRTFSLCPTDPGQLLLVGSNLRASPFSLFWFYGAMQPKLSFLCLKYLM